MLLLIFHKPSVRGSKKKIFKTCFRRIFCPYLQLSRVFSIILMKFEFFSGKRRHFPDFEKCDQTEEKTGKERS
ncbi:hypothetical protein HMPREF1141_2156 [Clostridium sp. MSTE9]|nr:hypothetical protein HMPREF1141_2156 [Clostridium sp. MSTE9]